MASHLRLVTEDEPVNLPAREPSTFEDGWNARQGMMKKRGDGKDKTRKLWDRHAKKVGSARLLEALKRYLREEKEPTCGYPGLSVWLNGERYDHWTVDDRVRSGDPSAHNRPTTPEALRFDLVSALGESFVRSYLDPCTFHEDDYITPASGVAMKKLIEKASVLKAAGVAGIRRKD